VSDDDNTINSTGHATPSVLGTRQPSQSDLQKFMQRENLLGQGEIINEVYRVIGLIGEGGMGQVYEAYDPFLDRSVAIKMSWPHIEPHVLATEARTLASLRHPGLVSVHGMGTHRGSQYVVFERLHGRTLRDHLAIRQSEQSRVQFTMDETLDILVSLADVLAYIHRNGVVHRDIKPANIMLENQNRLVLMDFGLVYTTDEPPDGNTGGSPHYIAPETITGKMASDQSTRVDIYSMGVVAFELLTGVRPFEGDSLGEILDKHLDELPPDVRSNRGDVSVHLARLVTEMMAKDPSKRPGSANIIAMWLRALQRGRTLPGSRRGFSVLVVDDDPDMIGLISACVEHAVPSADIRKATNGLEALAQFRVAPPDLLLVDLEMPEMTGVELCMYLRGTTLAERTSIVAVSAHDSKRERMLLSELGVAYFLSKQAASDTLLNDLVQTVRRIHDHRTRISRPSY